jgi:hypothetical protein
MAPGTGKRGETQRIRADLLRLTSLAAEAQTVIE